MDASSLAHFETAARPLAIEKRPEVLDSYARSISLASTRPAGVVFPRSREEVEGLVRAAVRTGVALYPISRGCNWGYGDACASSSGQVIVDLKEMNQILEVNERLGYAVIQPGVTQRQLWEHLQARGLRLAMDATGAGGATSIVGNCLERGFGHGRLGDRFANVCSMEVVLGSGETLRTGFGHYGGARAHRVYRYGVGPFLDGLFTQSNFGIVTELALWLAPVPERFCAFFCSTQDADEVAEMIDAIASLRAHGIIQSNVHVGNDLRVMSGRFGYPWDRAGGQTPLPAELRATLRHELTIGPWSAAGALQGTRAMVAAARREVRRALGRFGVRFVDDRKLALATRIQRVLARFGLARRFGERLAAMRPVYALMQGEPSDAFVRGASWRVRGSDGGRQNPIDGAAGLFCASPILPAQGALVREVSDRIERTMARFGFDPLITWTLLSERAVCGIINVCFDRREEDESKRAAACHQALLDELEQQGYRPYRVGPWDSQRLDRGSMVFWDICHRLKRALDPEGIVAPGRYEPARAPRRDEASACG